jgi:Replication-relaxation
MAGSNERGFVLQDRDRDLLRELATMRVLDREQAKIVAGFHSTTRANYRLLSLTRAGLLRRFFLGTKGAGMKALYALSPEGARLVGVPLRGPKRGKDETLTADFFVEHQLTINEVYCALKYGKLPAGVSFRRWLTFFAPIVHGLRLIPDGYAELGTSAGITALFLEVDLGHEHGPVWRRKVEHYLQFALMQTPEAAAFHRPFRVLVVAPGERRVESLRKAVGRLTEKIFWFRTLESIRGEGFFAPVWRRPRGEERLPLIKEIL